MMDIGVKGIRLKFQNKFCACPYRKKAEVRISQSENNPGRLFFRCADGNCGFVEWWRPAEGDICSERKKYENVSELLHVRIDEIVDTCCGISKVVQHHNDNLLLLWRGTLVFLFIIAIVAWKLFQKHVFLSTFHFLISSVATNAGIVVSPLFLNFHK